MAGDPGYGMASLKQRSHMIIGIAKRTFDRLKMLRDPTKLMEGPGSLLAPMRHKRLSNISACYV